jgi:hypothetical protein
MNLPLYFTTHHCCRKHKSGSSSARKNSKGKGAKKANKVL